MLALTILRERDGCVGWRLVIEAFGMVCAFKPKYEYMTLHKLGAQPCAFTDGGLLQMEGSETLPYEKCEI